MKHFRVKTGYGKDEFISIEESELQSAIRAQVTGKVGVFKEGTISGNHIISITPDFNREMGIARDYPLTGEDYDILGKTKVNEYRDFFQVERGKVLEQIEGRKEPKKLT